MFAPAEALVDQSDIFNENDVFKCDDNESAEDNTPTFALTTKPHHKRHSSDIFPDAPKMTAVIFDSTITAKDDCSNQADIVPCQCSPNDQTSENRACQNDEKISTLTQPQSIVKPAVALDPVESNQSPPATPNKKFYLSVHSPESLFSHAFSHHHHHSPLKHRQSLQADYSLLNHDCHKIEYSDDFKQQQELLMVPSNKLIRSFSMERLRQRSGNSENVESDASFCKYSYVASDLTGGALRLNKSMSSTFCSTINHTSCFCLSSSVDENVEYMQAISFDPHPFSKSKSMKVKCSSLQSSRDTLDTDSLSKTSSPCNSLPPSPVGNDEESDNNVSLIEQEQNWPLI